LKGEKEELHSYDLSTSFSSVPDKPGLAAGGDKGEERNGTNEKEGVNGRLYEKRGQPRNQKNKGGGRI